MEQPPYLNQMLLLETTMPPRELMHAGRPSRKRTAGCDWRTGDRDTLDIDIVRYGDLSLAEPDLVLPHPGLAMREFWQREIAELESHDR
jgi:2-amino-4-hydroxy-6-hydroxymethyldihydropteridine diphosphokinase